MTTILTILFMLQLKGDFDLDGDVDQSDWGIMQVCMGENRAYPEFDARCQPCDLNDDWRIDGQDADLFAEIERMPR
jgi:hypothetical protein